MFSGARQMSENYVKMEKVPLQAETGRVTCKTGLFPPQTGRVTRETGLFLPQTGRVTRKTGLFPPQTGRVTRKTGLFPPSNGTYHDCPRRDIRFVR